MRRTAARPHTCSHCAAGSPSAPPQGPLGLAAGGLTRPGHVRGPGQASSSGGQEPGPSLSKCGVSLAMEGRLCCPLSSWDRAQECRPGFLATGPTGTPKTRTVPAWPEGGGCILSHGHPTPGPTGQGTGARVRGSHGRPRCSGVSGCSPGLRMMEGLHHCCGRLGRFCKPGSCWSRSYPSGAWVEVNKGL